MTYNTATIQSRIDRISSYFPDPALRSIITKGVIDKPIAAITNEDVHAGLEEGTWSYNLLNHIKERPDAQELKTYIAAFTALEARKEWGKWSVDSANHDWAPIWVRLTDKLRQTIAKKQDIKLSKENDELVTETYNRYKDVKHGVDERRRKHDEIDKDFDSIFKDPKYSEVRKAVLQPVTDEVTPKHCGLFLLEIADAAQQKEYISLYYEALTAQAKLPLAKKLADYFIKHIGKEYAEKFTGNVPKDVEAHVKKCDEIFRKALG